MAPPQVPPGGAELDGRARGGAERPGPAAGCQHDRARLEALSRVELAALDLPIACEQASHARVRAEVDAMDARVARQGVDEPVDVDAPIVRAPDAHLELAAHVGGQSLDLARIDLAHAFTAQDLAIGPAVEHRAPAHGLDRVSEEQHAVRLDERLAEALRRIVEEGRGASREFAHERVGPERPQDRGVLRARLGAELAPLEEHDSLRPGGPEVIRGGEAGDAAADHEMLDLRHGSFPRVMRRGGGGGSYRSSSQRSMIPRRLARVTAPFSRTRSWNSL